MTIISCVLLSHHKPATVQDAVRSVLGQSSADWRLLVIDSGDLAADLRQYTLDPRVTVRVSPDPPRCQGWQHNEAYRRGWITGDLVCFLSDDDTYFPGAFAGWLERVQGSPHESAWFGDAGRTSLFDGVEEYHHTLTAAIGERLSQQIDGMQVCCRRGLLAVAPWPEGDDYAIRAIADGLWMDALQATTTVHPLGVMIGSHRHTKDSQYTQTLV